MNVRYELKKGVRLSAEDVTIVPVEQPRADAPTRDARQVPLDLKPRPERERRPWEDANPRVKTSIRLEMDEVLKLKLDWIKEHFPNSAISAVCRRAVEKEAARLIAEWDATHPSA
ncbi:hypothetical protein LA345_38910 (plasmid) [Burkholderia vietnamiensis]|uniref:Uncharacterized protein n=1 Tax=Burkholderia vietnamiensis (strain G4 / LMG 22486) TaxID=269482 RepID=A4JWE2_BURVG|nr:hypothetical protein Bcep1808_7725 [Burkholderia vietnamiensis G4]MCB4349770.1 hypothetical protein [Burkholderia vietnamiensis]